MHSVARRRRREGASSTSVRREARSPRRSSRTPTSSTLLRLPRYVVDHLVAGPIGRALVQASDAGAIVWGASAGAIALGGGVDVSGDDGPGVYPGLAWIDAAVFPLFQGRWEDVAAHLPAAIQRTRPRPRRGALELRRLVGPRIAGRVPDTYTANQVRAVPHERAIVANPPRWQRFSALPPFPDELRAWWWNAERGQSRVV